MFKNRNDGIVMILSDFNQEMKSDGLYSLSRIANKFNLSINLTPGEC